MPPGLFHRPLRWCTSAVALVGVGLAIVGAVRAFPRLGVGAGLTFVAVATVLTVLTALFLARLRIGEWAAVVLLVVQPGAAVGSAVELLVGVSGTKASQLRRLGFDPTVGVAINLVYSAAACVPFGWAVVRWRAGRRGPRRASGPLAADPAGR